MGESQQLQQYRLKYCMAPYDNNKNTCLISTDKLSKMSKKDIATYVTDITTKILPNMYKLICFSCDAIGEKPYVCCDTCKKYFCNTCSVLYNNHILGGNHSLCIDCSSKCKDCKAHMTTTNSCCVCRFLFCDKCFGQTHASKYYKTCDNDCARIFMG